MSNAAFSRKIKAGLVLVLGLALLHVNYAFAEPNGISGFSGEGADCTVCHGGGATASVALTADSGSTTVTPGSTSSYTLTLTGGPAVVAGFDIHLTAGSVIDTNASGTKILNGELVQSTPNNMSGGSISWTFDWVAPTAEGTYSFFAAGMSSNDDGGLANDATAVTSLQVTVAGVNNQAPVAAIFAPATGVEGVAVTFDGGGSSDTDGTIELYEWDFNDGSMGSGVNVTHTFNGGSYDVTLTVTDDAGATDTATHTIDIAVPNVAPTASISGPSNGTEGISVTFDGSGSTDPDGNIISYDWDFGDNSAGSGVSTSHIYAQGSYTVTLTVTDNEGATGNDSWNIDIAAVTAPQAPVADAGGPYAETVDIAVQFDGSGSIDPDGTILSYEWDFGDGNTGTGVGPMHIYTASGTYDVTLTVTDNDQQTGTSQTTAEIAAVTAPQAPVADAGGPYAETVDIAVQFDGSGSIDPDGTILSYEWDFGDGTTGTGVGPMHIYTASGTYNVTLTVTDNDQQTGTGQTTAEIAAAPTPEPPPTPDPGAPGEELYNTYCAACHGAGGVGGKDGDVVGEDAKDIMEAIEDEREMRFLGSLLSESDVDAIADYLNSGDGDGDDDHDGKNRDDDDDDDDADKKRDRDGDKNKNRDRDKDSDMEASTIGSTDSVSTSDSSGGGGALHWLTLILSAVWFAIRLRKMS